MLKLHNLSRFVAQTLTHLQPQDPQGANVLFITKPKIKIRTTLMSSP